MKKITIFKQQKTKRKTRQNAMKNKGEDLLKKP